MNFRWFDFQTGLGYGRETLEIHKMRAVIVTGASRGLGSFLVYHLRNEGINVIGVARSQLETWNIVEPVTQDAGKLIKVQGNIADTQIQQEVISRAVQEFGRIDGIVLNAGFTPF